VRVPQGRAAPLVVEVPKWEPLLDMHPCDFQSSMLKGCTPSDNNSVAFYSEDRRREVRSKYYAMVAEVRPLSLSFCLLFIIIPSRRFLSCFYYC
jgi:hypothetical protein